MIERYLKIIISEKVIRPGLPYTLWDPLGPFGFWLGNLESVKKPSFSDGQIKKALEYKKYDTFSK